MFKRLWNFLKRDTEYDLPLRTRIWMALGLCRKGFRHDWQLDSPKGKRKCRKCEKIQHWKEYYPFGFPSGWEDW